MPLINKENLSKEVKSRYYMFEFSISTKGSNNIRKEKLMVDKFSSMGAMWELIVEEVDKFKNRMVYDPFLMISEKLIEYNKTFNDWASITLMKQGKFDMINNELVTFGYYPCRMIS